MGTLASQPSIHTEPQGQAELFDELRL